MNDTIKLIQSHQSVRHYLDQQIDESIVEELFASAQSASSSSFFQSYSMIRVGSSEQRQVLFEISDGQAWLQQAPLVVLFCADLNRSYEFFQHIDRDVLGYAEQLINSVTDAALAAQNLALAAESLGLGIVFVGGIRNDTRRIIERFQLPKMVFPLYAVCIGYPRKKGLMRPRIFRDVIVKEDIYEENKRERILEYDRVIEQYYIERGEGPVSWTSHSGKLLMNKTRADVGKALVEQGFLQGTDCTEPRSFE